MSRLIALTGLAGSGKSTVAKHLVTHHGYRVEKFAGPLKDMLRAFGLTEAHIEGTLKEVPCDLLGGKSPRYAMQTLGVEWGRDLISPSLWVDAWASRAAEGLVVTDDCRFPNEASAVRALGGIVVRVARSGITSASGHVSESGQDGIEPDVILGNYGSIDDLHSGIARVLSY